MLGSSGFDRLVHIEEFLGVSAIARDLKAASSDPEYSLEAILARARAGDDSPVATPLAARDRGRSDQAQRPMAASRSGDGGVRLCSVLACS